MDEKYDVIVLGTGLKVCCWLTMLFALGYSTDPLFAVSLYGVPSGPVTMPPYVVLLVSAFNSMLYTCASRDSRMKFSVNITCETQYVFTGVWIRGNVVTVYVHVRYI